MPTVDLTRIGSNIGAMYSLQSLLDINNKLATHQTRLSTGRRINSAADDPAGLVIATKMNARSEGLRVVQDNISDAKNMLSVAESGLGKLTDIITQMRSKATQAASDTLGATERATIQTQLSQFAEQIDDILAETKWNGVKLLDGTANKVFQTGVDTGETTNWIMDTILTAEDGLGLSNTYDTTGGSVQTFNSTSFTGTAGLVSIARAANTSELATGSYSVEVLNKATSATVGTIDRGTNPILAGVTAVSTGTPDTELASGNYTLKITSIANATNVSYTITNNDTNVTKTFSNAFIGDGELRGKWADQTVTTLSTKTGIHLTLATGNPAVDLQAGSQMSFEYIAANNYKLELNDASNVATTISFDGEGGATQAAYAYKNYATNGGVFNTGRGMTVTMAAVATSVVGDTIDLDFHGSGDYVVDVSTAAKASTYMGLANTAMDKINGVMADLGSLMARMSIKEEAASSARINVESAYNRIMNANMAEEQVNASKYMVLQQTAVAMLAQANNAPQALLSLFR